MKITTLLVFSSVFVLGLAVSSGAHEPSAGKSNDLKNHLRVVSLPSTHESTTQATKLGNGSSGQTACVPSLSRDDLKSVVMGILRENPRMIIKALESQSIELAELVDQGSMLKVVKEEEERRLDELANPKVANISTERPIRGNPTATITIVEYSDFECPFCEAAHQTVKKVLEQYGQNVRFIYKHNPLSFHALAEPAARYFEAIALQNPKLSWEFHDRVFEAQSELGAQGEDGLKAIVRALPIDLTRFEQDLTSQVVEERLAIDLEEAQRFGFDGTPAFLVNGVSLMGNRPLGDFEELIELAMGEKAEQARLKVAEIHRHE